MKKALLIFIVALLVFCIVGSTLFGIYPNWNTTPLFGSNGILRGFFGFFNGFSNSISSSLEIFISRNSGFAPIIDDYAHYYLFSFSDFSIIFAYRSDYSFGITAFFSENKGIDLLWCSDPRVVSFRFDGFQAVKLYDIVGNVLYHRQVNFLLGPQWPFGPYREITFSQVLDFVDGHGGSGGDF